MRVSNADASKIALWICVILVFYLSYRYPFQINFSGTSQVYSDTPIYLQLPKFVLAFVACVFLLLFCDAGKINKKSLIICLMFVCIEIISALKGIVLMEGGYFDSVFWAIVAFVMALYLQSVSGERMYNYIKILFFVAFFVDLLQFSLFVLTGRLPALAWEGTFSIRFGSFLDDPNGFSALCFMFLGWAYSVNDVKNRIIYTAMAVVMIFMSQSLTAVGFLLVIFSLWFIKNIIFPGNIALKSIFLVIAIGFGFGLEYIIQFISFVYEIKQGSIEDHAAVDMSLIYERSFLGNLVGVNEYVHYESWWLRSLINMGLIWTFGSLVAMIFYIVFLYKKWIKLRSFFDGGVVFSIFTFSLFFFLGSINLPFFTVFPINFIYYFMLFWVLLKYGCNRNFDVDANDF